MNSNNNAPSLQDLQDVLIRDNKKYGKVADFLKEKIKEGSSLCIVSAYFTIYAYYALKDNFDAIDHLDFLFGDPTFVKIKEEGEQKNFCIKDDTLSLDTQEQIKQKNIAKECAKWIKEKVDIRSIVKPDFLHGKLYHITSASKETQEAILGSSNFTPSGLGLKAPCNIELNFIVDSRTQTKKLKEWFLSIWNDKTGLVQDVKEQVLEYLGQLYKENTPEFIYLRTLYGLFGDVKNTGLGDIEKSKEFMKTDIWNALYDFQKVGVRSCLDKINKFGGCILADSVGLGKTYEALALIKYFEIENYSNVLVLCPKKLEANWKLYPSANNRASNPFIKDNFRYTVLYHTDLGRTQGKNGNIHFNDIKWDEYDLVVIDESHNFRGNAKIRTQETGEKTYNRAGFLMQKIIKARGKNPPKMILLSATPVNTSLKDLRNQISFITAGNPYSLKEKGIDNIDMLLRVCQKQYASWSAKEKNKTTKTLYDELDPAFFLLMNTLTIARSRKQIIQFYKGQQEQLGGFSKRLPPQSEYCNIDTQNLFPSFAQIDKRISGTEEKEDSGYKLSVYSPSFYLKDEATKKKYRELSKVEQENFTLQDRETYLVGMIKTNFLKRLESSIDSFTSTLSRTVGIIKETLQKIENFETGKTSAIENNLATSLQEKEYDDTEDEDIESFDYVVGKKFKYDLKDINVETWKKDLRQDYDILNNLLQEAQKITPQRDAKLQRLKQIIKEKMQKPFNDCNKKVLVFTAYKDTALYLYNNLFEWAKKELKIESALVTGNTCICTYGKNNFEDILLNFSPVSKNRGNYGLDDTSQIDLLIATDCISEGQNLQDCDYLVNYDVHWNPVRLVQRFGRIDRIGSKNKQIKLVNFWPTKDLDEYINLEQRVKSRMILANMSATGDENILDLDDNFSAPYRIDQLKRFDKEVPEIEELCSAPTLQDFSLDIFRGDLYSALDNMPNAIKDAPLGLYAIVPKEKLSGTRKGVIFCLKKKNAASFLQETTQNEKNKKALNLVYPYFLVYIKDTGEVLYNFLNIKQVLDIFKRLCSGDKNIYKDLCKSFEKETQGTQDMSAYFNLLKKSVQDIANNLAGKNSKKATNTRTGGWGASFETQLGPSDFELFTWLVIK